MSDKMVAKISGIHMRSVTRKRQRLKIPASWMNYHNWKKAELRLLGTMPDAELARKMNVTKTSVTVKRQQLKIASYGPQRHRWTPEELRRLGTVPTLNWQSKWA